MANHLKMAEVQAIQALREQSWSLWRITRMLRISRATVKRHVELGAGGGTISPLAGGSEGHCRPNPPTGSDGQTGPKPPAGNPSPASRCEPFRDTVIAALEWGLSYQQTW